MADIKWELDSKKIDWVGTISDVVTRIYAIRDCWRASESGDPELHKKLISDVYAPAMTLIAKFVTTVEINEVDNEQKTLLH